MNSLDLIKYNDNWIIKSLINRKNEIKFNHFNNYFLRNNYFRL